MLGRRRSREDDRAELTRETVLRYLEGLLDREERERVEQRVRSSRKDREFFESLRREVEARNLSISLVWKEERITCPHRDVLEAYHYGSLRDDEADYIAFHVERIGCPYCAANLEDIASGDKPLSDKKIRGARDELLRSTTYFLRRRPPRG